MDQPRPPILMRVDATGTRRRLQALVSIGYTQHEIRLPLGLSAPALSQILHQRQKTVPTRLDAAARRLFSQLWAHPVTGPEGSRSRTIAQLHGWVSPLAWDDIDDPTEKPNLAGPPPRRKRAGGEDEALDDAPGTLPPRKEYIDEAAVLRAMQGHPTRLTHLERQLAITRLHARRWSDIRIAKTLRVSDKTVLRHRQDLGLDAYELADMELEDSA